MAFKDYSTLISGGIGAVGTFLGSQENRKGLEAQAEALKSKGYSDVEVARLMLEGKRLDLELAKSGGAKSGGVAGNKTLYIGLGVGAVVVLGVVIFAVTRKKA
jgi:hypothetical protein